MCHLFSPSLSLCLFLNSRNSLITAEQSEEWTEEMKTKALNVKTEMETANETREKELHKKLSQAKMTLLSDLVGFSLIPFTLKLLFLRP